MDYIYKNNLSFILNDDSEGYQTQKESILKAISCRYEIEIIFVYRDKSIAKAYTRQRENSEGKIVSDSSFEAKYKNSIKTTKKILDEFESISFRYIDLEAKEIFKNSDGRGRLGEIESINNQD
ncbi:MAG: zeta toxin family protein [Campylobacterales bacterium]